MRTVQNDPRRVRGAKAIVLLAFAAVGGWTAFGQTGAGPSAPAPAAPADNRVAAAPAIPATNAATNAQAPAAAAAPAGAPAAGAATGAAPVADEAAGLFIRKCAGCHTIGKGKLTGPDLNVAATWQAPDLDKAIKVMEAKVGPLKEAEIVSLRDFLKSADVRDRLAAEQERASRALAATLAPADADVGLALFSGSKPLANGGLACISCHAANGTGGTLAVSLDGVFTKLGETPLQSAIEKTSFKVMTAAYRDHPVTKQEALHLTKYFETLPDAAPVAATRVPYAGTALAVLLFVSLGFAYRGRSMSVRRQLQRRSRHGMD